VNKCKIFNITDIHLGHNNTTTKFIVNNIYSFFIDNSELLKNVDIITISGDYYHKLLSIVSEDYKLSIDCLLFLAKFCERNDIYLYILHGTPSHDMDQLKKFSDILNTFKIPLVYKYIDTLTIEHIDKFDMDILFIPDEVSHSASETQDMILELLREHRLETVGHVVMHGQFHYHLPVVSAVSFDEEFMLSICDGYIVNGHIHIFSTYERILTPGSFDRMTHGEEGKKGAILIAYDGLGGMEYIFLENKNAKLYKTIRYESLDSTDIVSDISMLKLPDDSFVRIISNNKSDKSMQSILRTTFRTLNIKIETNTNDIEERTITDTMTIKFNELHITRANIKDLVRDRIKYGDKDAVIKHLSNFI
jgi:hypothetical protein